MPFKEAVTGPALGFCNDRPPSGNNDDRLCET